MQNILGMLVGAEIDREEGGSGVEGALLGSLSESAGKLLAPLVVTFAVGWGVQFLARRALDAVAGASGGRR
jgi:hypothetical protein